MTLVQEFGERPINLITRSPQWRANAIYAPCFFAHKRSLVLFLFFYHYQIQPAHNDQHSAIIPRREEASLQPWRLQHLPTLQTGYP